MEGRWRYPTEGAARELDNLRDRIIRRGSNRPGRFEHWTSRRTRRGSDDYSPRSIQEEWQRIKRFCSEQTVMRRQWRQTTKIKFGRWVVEISADDPFTGRIGIDERAAENGWDKRHSERMNNAEDCIIPCDCNKHREREGCEPYDKATGSGVPVAREWAEPWKHEMPDNAATAAKLLKAEHARAVRIVKRLQKNAERGGSALLGGGYKDVLDRTTRRRRRERTDEEERIRQQPLNDRLGDRRRTGICAQGRCPKMTIPGHSMMTTISINTTLADAQTIAEPSDRSGRIDRKAPTAVSMFIWYV